MIARSVVVVLLTVPTSIVLVALVLAATPPLPGLRVPLVLFVIPLWMVLATACFLIPKASTAAVVLLAVSLGGYAVIQLLAALGLGGA
ncbi:MAG: hypothetical protein AAGG11_24700 [Pseudomonadota bacterium]